MNVKTRRDGVLPSFSPVRLRFAWWPLHPIILLVGGTYPMSRLAASFLMGALIKWATVRLGGIRGYHQLLPLMVGIIAGELLAATSGLASARSTTRRPA